LLVDRKSGIQRRIVLPRRRGQTDLEMREADVEQDAVAQFLGPGIGQTSKRIERALVRVRRHERGAEVVERLGGPVAGGDGVAEV
jgi:hypothetical protein